MSAKKQPTTINFGNLKSNTFLASILAFASASNFLFDVIKRINIALYINGGLKTPSNTGAWGKDFGTWSVALALVLSIGTLAVIWSKEKRVHTLSLISLVLIIAGLIVWYFGLHTVWTSGTDFLFN